MLFTGGAVTNQLRSWYTKWTYSVRRWTSSSPKRSARNGDCCRNYRSSSKSPDRPRQYQMRKRRSNATMTSPRTGNQAEQFHFRRICLNHPTISLVFLFSYLSCISYVFSHYFIALWSYSCGWFATKVKCSFGCIGFFGNGLEKKRYGRTFAFFINIGSY